MPDSSRNQIIRKMYKRGRSGRKIRREISENSHRLEYRTIFSACFHGKVFGLMPRLTAASLVPDDLGLSTKLLNVGIVVFQVVLCGCGGKLDVKVSYSA